MRRFLPYIVLESSLLYGIRILMTSAAQELWSTPVDLSDGTEELLPGFPAINELGLYDFRQVGANPLSSIPINCELRQVVCCDTS